MSYEINTRVWLDELSRKAQRPSTLAAVPDEEWAAVAAPDFDAVWLMGVWFRKKLSFGNWLLIRGRIFRPDLFRPTLMERGGNVVTEASEDSRYRWKQKEATRPILKRTNK
jgi:hypothetical protein